MQKVFRIGQIVPSSNVTMETEIPAMLRARESIRAERFTFHSSRMRMKKVTKEELAAMDAEVRSVRARTERRTGRRSWLRLSGGNHEHGARLSPRVREAAA